MNGLKKHFGKYIDYAIYRQSIAFAIIYCCLFNTSFMILRFNNSNLPISTAAIELIRDFLYLNIMMFIFFFGLSIQRSLFLIGSLFMFITGAIATYYLFYFDISPSYMAMHKLYNSDIKDIYDSITIRITVWIIFSIAIFTFSYKHFKAETTKLFFSKILSSICLLVLVNSIISPPFDFMKHYCPTKYLHNSFRYFFGEDI